MKSENLNFVAKKENKKPSSPLLYGAFFEDINHSLDGGLNANLVQNGSFDFCAFSYNKPVVKNEYFNLKFWEVKNAKVVTEKPISENKPFSLKINLKNKTEIKNLGYEIFNGNNFMFLAEKSYTASFFYICDCDVECNVFFEYENGKTSKTETIKLLKTSNYTLAKCVLKSAKQEHAKLVFSFNGKGLVYVTHFKLIPENFFVSKRNKYNYGKFNANIVKSLDFGAKFLRFPGGCLVEGDADLNYLYEWEKTIGPTETRASKPSVWNYLQSNEIGFFEYFCLCEDLGMLPLPVHHVGIICQIRTEVFRHLGYIYYRANSKLFKEKVVDSVAHLIYFALGDVNSKDKIEHTWANKRKSMGHPKPFNLKMIALGNENWDKVYFKNFSACVAALQKYPHQNKPTNLIEKFGLTIVTSSGVDINPQDTNPSWKYLNKHYSNLIVDEHVYNTPTWFIDNFYRYDYYNPKYSKVFMGEYASHSNADGLGRLGGKNNFESALSEAVFVCGMENNPDIVKMSCYAPLLCKEGQSNWDPNLIYFNKNKIRHTPSCVVQSLFAKNYGKFSIKLDCNKNFCNSGKFSAKMNKNDVKNIEFFNLNKKPIAVKLTNCATKENLFNYFVKISFNKICDGFTLNFGEQANFKFMLHYNIQDKALYYEKIVNGLRMTLERLADVDLKEDICVKYDENEIVVYLLRNKPVLIAKKQIWKTNTNVFTSLTYDNEHIYLKIVNVGEKTKAKFNFIGLLKHVSIATQTIVTAKSDDEGSKITKTLTLAPEFELNLKEKSINVVVIDK